MPGEEEERRDETPPKRQYSHACQRRAGRGMASCSSEVVLKVVLEQLFLPVERQPAARQAAFRVPTQRRLRLTPE